MSTNRFTRQALDEQNKKREQDLAALVQKMDRELEDYLYHLADNYFSFKKQDDENGMQLGSRVWWALEKNIPDTYQESHSGETQVIFKPFVVVPDAKNNSAQYAPVQIAYPIPVFTVVKRLGNVANHIREAQLFQDEEELLYKFNKIQELRAISTRHPTMGNQEKIRAIARALKKYRDDEHDSINEVLENLCKHRSKSPAHALFRDQRWKRAITNMLALLTVLPAIGLAVYSLFSHKKSLNFMATSAELTVGRIQGLVKQAQRLG